MLDNLTFKDGIFIAVISFILMVILLPFIELPEDGSFKIIYLVELYVIVLFVCFFAYSFLKQKSNEASYLTQERIFLGLFLIVMVIVVFVMSREIFAMRKSRNGFILYITAILGVIIIILALMANTALNKRYALDLQNPFEMLHPTMYGNMVNSYKN